MLRPYGHNRVTKQCLACGRDFVSYDSAKRKYCSQPCMRNWRQAQRGWCRVCGKPVMAGRKSYCSSTCYGIGQRGTRRPKTWKRQQRQCESCGKPFIAGGRSGKKADQRYCSMSCSGRGQRISIQAFWKKGGKTSSIAWDELRGRMFRDNGGRCEFCTNKGTQIHHLLPRRYGGGEDLSNLALVCSYCHRALDSFLTVLARNRGEEAVRGSIREVMALVRGHARLAKMVM